MTDDQILAELRKASDGLLYMSESDYPFELVHWDGKVELTKDYLCEVAGQPAGSPILELSVGQFLSGPFESVGRLVERYLADARVYKIGDINIPVYVVGRSPEGNWLGLSTRVVET
jgi:Nuclease A inhibitor-like protein